MTAPADVTAALQSKFPQVTPRPSGDHPAFNVPSSEVIVALKYLRDELSYDMLIDVTAVDWGVDASPRFTVIWHLLSTTNHGYVRLASDCANDIAPVAPTATGLWPAAD